MLFTKRQGNKEIEEVKKDKTVSFKTDSVPLKDKKSREPSRMVTEESESHNKSGLDILKDLKSSMAIKKIN